MSALAVKKKENVEKKLPTGPGVIDENTRLRRIKQWKTSTRLYQLIASNELDDQVKRTIEQVLKALQVTSINESLLKSYDQKELEKYKEYAHTEYDKMGQINRERMESLVGLATTEMKRAILDSLCIFDINPEAPPLELHEKTGIDAEGNPVYATHVFPVFQKDVLSGIKGLVRFLPQELIAGNPQIELPGLQQFFRSQYARFGARLGENPSAKIRSLTTIGSLGGIGHKPDSDMDAQVIFDTNPGYEGPWNDADFFVALLQTIFYQTQQHIFHKILSDDEKSELVDEVEQEMKEKYGEGLSDDEVRVIRLIFPSIFEKTLESKLWDRFNQQPSVQQATILWQEISRALNKQPFFERYIQHLTRFFSFIKVKSDEKIRRDWFPYSLKILTKDKLWGWVTDYYNDNYLDHADALQIVEQYAEKTGVAVDKITTEQKQEALLQQLSGFNQRSPVIKGFLRDLTEKISLDSQHRLGDIFHLTKQQFDPDGHFLNKRFADELKILMQEYFRSQMVALVDFCSEVEAITVESNCTYPIHQKILHAEKYLTQKYPETEVHFFVNLLRNQRNGKHTPFLVSPEGSMAYDLMLNDFLLNPAVLLGGTSPAPFELPHDLKVLARIGVLPEEDWVLTQKNGDQVEEFPLRDLPDWGEMNIPREKFLEHAIPIFLRESEKVSHRNLPKALLNCWWLEMICCLEEDNTPPTSMTKLLFNPDQRYFIRQDLSGPLVRTIKVMEKEFPLLPRDPWWLKFTEMLLRFEEEEVQQEIIFCFSQHIRLSDIIDFNNDGQAIRLDEPVSWRTNSLVRFYDLFFQEKEQRQDLIKFCQGRDDVGNRVELKLKLLFLKSMRRVELKLINTGNTKSLKMLMGYILKKGGDTIGPKAKTVAGYVLNQLQELNQKLLIVDERIVHKVEDELPLNSIEQLQWEQIQEDRERVKATVDSIVQYLEKFGLTPLPHEIEKRILDSRIMLAGDPLENVIFKYHFERNFKHKPFQVPFPISKSLSIPRKRITLQFNSKSQKWIFKSMLSRKEAMGNVSRYADRSGSELEMFEAPLVEGIARCVLSGYLGFTERNLTSFEKPPARSLGNAASNPVTHQDLQIIATEMHQFFRPIPVRPKELLENIHYIRDIFIVCNVNRFSRISVVVRDNFGDHFVTGFDISRIQVKIRPSHMKVDFNLSRFFMQFNTRECRIQFMKALDVLNIPLLSQYKFKSKIWINSGNFKLLGNPKFHKIYLDGIVHALWDLDLIGTPEFLEPKKLKTSIDFLGKEAVRNRRQRPA
ncbi:MAG: hypothetical protein HQM14_01305 [SAR324 cluster bacterium]|nr:hypothetical protein [SAR324 cluster bacterium]